MSDRYNKAPPAEGLARNYSRGFHAAKKYTRQVPDDAIVDRVRQKMEDLIRAELLDELRALSEGRVS